MRRRCGVGGIDDNAGHIAGRAEGYIGAGQLVGQFPGQILQGRAEERDGQVQVGAGRRRSGGGGMAAAFPEGIPQESADQIDRAGGGPGGKELGQLVKDGGYSWRRPAAAASCPASGAALSSVSAAVGS